MTIGKGCNVDWPLCSTVAMVLFGSYLAFLFLQTQQVFLVTLVPPAFRTLTSIFPCSFGLIYHLSWSSLRMREMDSHSAFIPFLNNQQFSPNFFLRIYNLVHDIIWQLFGLANDGGDSVYRCALFTQVEISIICNWSTDCNLLHNVYYNVCLLCNARWAHSHL